jgi:hypothetical protein
MDKHTPPTNITKEKEENPHRKKDNVQRKIDIMLQEYKEIKGSLNTIISK